MKLQVGLPAINGAGLRHVPDLEFSVLRSHSSRSFRQPLGGLPRMAPYLNAGSGVPGFKDVTSK